MSKRRSTPDRPRDHIRDTSPVTSEISVYQPTTEVGIATREARKREIARRILPFFKQIADKAKKVRTSYSREKLELIVEACRDYLMDEAEHDPTLTFDQQLGIAEMVSGVAKGWSFAREFLDKGAVEHMLPLYVVCTDKIEEIAKALEIKVVWREEEDPVPVTKEVMYELQREPGALESGDSSQSPPK